MFHPHPCLRALLPGFVSVAVLLMAAHANAQSPVTVSLPTTAQFRAVIAGASGDYVTVPCTISVEAGAPATPGVGAVLVRSIHIVAPATFSCAVPLQGTPTQVSLSGLVIDAASGIGVLLPAQAGSPGETLFAGGGVDESAAGIINYTAQGLACQAALVGGGQCSGPFNLATPGPNSGAVIAGGSIAPLAAGQPHAVTFQLRGSFPFVSTGSWGRVEMLATLAGTIPGDAPACPADFNGVGGLNVQDIFDFLAAWFTGSPAADFNHVGGLGVQDIFDFLAAWFGGC